MILVWDGMGLICCQELHEGFWAFVINQLDSCSWKCNLLSSFSQLLLRISQGNLLVNFLQSWMSVAGCAVRVNRSVKIHCRSPITSHISPATFIPHWRTPLMFWFITPFIPYMDASGVGAFCSYNFLSCVLFFPFHFVFEFLWCHFYSNTTIRKFLFC